MFIKKYKIQKLVNLSQYILVNYKKYCGVEGEKTTANLHGTVREQVVDDLSFFKDIKSELEVEVTNALTDYLSLNPLLDRNMFFLNHISLMHHHESFNIPFHYDAEFVYEKNERENIRNFAILLYLNDEFSGGDLLFPIQKINITPEEGLLVIFPTSFMYPHTTTPCFGGDRYVLRINYYFDKNAIINTVKDSTTY